jgi:P-type Cu+ transporter
MAIDPVCGMTVNEGRAKHRAVHEGTSFYFCSAGCASAFERTPHKYLSAGYRPSKLSAFRDWLRATFFKQ